MNISSTPYQPSGYGYRQYASVNTTTASSLRASNPTGITHHSATSNVPSALKQISNETPELSQAYTVTISGRRETGYQSPSVQQSGRSTQSNTDKTPNSPLNGNENANEEGRSPLSDGESSIDGNERATEASEQTDTGTPQLTEQELKLLAELKKSDAEVRSHELAHIGAGGQYVTSGAKLDFRKGPDGQNYAVAGEVSIDTSPIPGDPQATAQKMRQVQRAALAPASPSSQDRKVASRASAMAAKALSELMIQQVKERTTGNEQQAFGSIKQAADSYSKVDGMPMEEHPNHLDIAV